MNDSKPDQYAALIQSTLFLQPGLSRADLSSLLGIDRAMVTRVSQGLMQKGIIREGSSHEIASGAGRRPVSLFLNDQSMCILGLEVIDSFIKVGSFTVYGEALSSSRHNPEPGQSLEAWLLHVLEVEIDAARKRGFGVWAVGLAISGLINPDKGHIFLSPHLGIHSEPVNIKDRLEQVLGVPVFPDNDAKCCCYDVMTYGELQDRQNFLYLFGDLIEQEGNTAEFHRVAIGSALVLDGKVQYGAHSASGEFRSALANPDVPGQFGRADQYRAIRSDSRMRQEFFQELGQNISLLANYLDLEAIHLGGGIEEFRDEAGPIFQRALEVGWVYRHVYPKPVALHFAKNGDKPALRGAAALAARKLFLS